MVYKFCSEPLVSLFQKNTDTLCGCVSAACVKNLLNDPRKQLPQQREQPGYMLPGWFVSILLVGCVFVAPSSPNLLLASSFVLECNLLKMLVLAQSGEYKRESSLVTENWVF